MTALQISAAAVVRSQAMERGPMGILRGKYALVFGAAGSVGSATAKEFAAVGAEVFVSGRTKASVDEVS
jgi:3-oxoacyl-[acyl-carrier protein] reductase